MICPFFPSCVFICLFVCLYQCEFMDIYFILWVVIQYDFILFVAEKLILYISCSIPRIIHFSKKPWLFLIEKWYENPRSVIIFSLLLGCHFFQILLADKAKYMCVYTHIYKWLLYVTTCFQSKLNKNSYLFLEL